MAHGAEGEGRVRDLDALRIARSVEPVRRSPLIPAVGALAALLVLGVAAYELYAHTIGKPLEVEVAPVTIKGAGQSGVLLTGSGYIITRDKYITVGCRVLGKIVDEPIEEGKHVKKGDVLARIEDTDYQANLNTAKADYELAKANLALAETQSKRQHTLFERGVLSRDEFDKQLNTESVSRAQVAKARAAIDLAQFNLDSTVVTSPIDGVVLKKYREVGSTINYGGDIQAGGGTTDIVQVANTDDMRVELDINESDISKVYLDMPASIVPDAYPDRSFDAKVVKIYPEADRQKGTVRVEVQFLKPDMDIIKPEMNTKVSFLASQTGEREQPMLLVPKKAIVGEGASAAVWTVRDGYAVKVPILAGREFQGGVEIKHGLTGGELVIVTPPETLKDHQAIVAKTSS